MTIIKAKPHAWKVALPMYRISPQLAEDYDAFLQAFIATLQRDGFNDPIEIVATGDDLMTWWRRPDVLLTQSCGYPFITSLHDQVQLIATPSFNVAGCVGGLYSSVFVTHIDQQSRVQILADARGGIAVINQADSNSGMNVLRYAVSSLTRTDESFFSAVKTSGAHLRSLAMIRDKAADIAAIDCVTFAYAQEHCPELTQSIHIIGQSVATSALPLIASNSVAPDVIKLIQASLKELLITQKALLARLHIADFIETTVDDYASILALETALSARGRTVMHW